MKSAPLSLSLSLSRHPGIRARIRAFSSFLITQRGVKSKTHCQLFHSHSSISIHMSVCMCVCMCVDCIVQAIDATRARLMTLDPLVPFFRMEERGAATTCGSMWIRGRARRADLSFFFICENTTPRFYPFRVRAWPFVYSGCFAERCGCSIGLAMWRASEKYRELLWGRERERQGQRWFLSCAARLFGFQVGINGSEFVFLTVGWTREMCTDVL